MAEPSVTYESNVGVAKITLNRPKFRNAIDYDLAIELHDAMLRADADESVRVITMTGAGNDFCVGLDINAIKDFAENGMPKRYLAKVMWPYDPSTRADYQGTHNYFPSINKPIIAVLNGAVAGLGLVFATYCDILFAADNALFTTAFARRGIPAEWGIAWLLPRLVGQANAAELLLSGRRFNASEALRMGLVARVYPAAELAEQAQAYAAEMAQYCAPMSLRFIKRQLWEAPFQTLSEASMMFKAYTVVCRDEHPEDMKEAALSFLEKRPPNFKGR